MGRRKERFVSNVTAQTLTHPTLPEHPHALGNPFSILAPSFFYFSTSIFSFLVPSFSILAPSLISRTVLASAASEFSPFLRPVPYSGTPFARPFFSRLCGFRSILTILHPLSCIPPHTPPSNTLNSHINHLSRLQQCYDTANVTLTRL